MKCPKCGVTFGDVPDRPRLQEATCPVCDEAIIWDGEKWQSLGFKAHDWVKKERHGGLF